MQVDDHLNCAGCSRSWPIVAGIPCLIEGQVVSEYGLGGDIDNINRQAEAIGWREAVEAYSRQTQRPDYAAEYINSEARADFRFLMPFDESSTVLDIGSGWGNISAAFARTCRRVVSVDTTFGNVRFVGIRAQQEGLDNVVAVMGDAAALPIRRETCDLAVMVGVLEWVAWGRSDGGPGEIQQQALQRVWQSLKPGGVLYIGIENRYAFKYFVGYREPHTRLRFVSLIPRFLGNVYSRLVRGVPYCEWTYSRSELEHLLRQTGFDKIDFWLPIPGYQNIRFLVAPDDRPAYDFVLERLQAHPRFKPWHRVAARLAFALGIHESLWPCFSVVATKPHD